MTAHLKNVFLIVLTERQKLKHAAHYGLMEYACGCACSGDKITLVTQVVVRYGVMVRVVSNVTRVMSDGECDGNMTGMISDS